MSFLSEEHTLTEIEAEISDLRANQPKEGWGPFAARREADYYKRLVLLYQERDSIIQSRRDTLRHEQVRLEKEKRERSLLANVEAEAMDIARKVLRKTTPSSTHR